MLPVLDGNLGDGSEVIPVHTLQVLLNHILRSTQWS